MKQKKLIEFVKESHKKQFRKYTGLTYFTHLENVSKLACKYLSGKLIFEIAICHDILEDVKYTNVDEFLLFKKLKEFGYDDDEATYIVSHVTMLSNQYEKIRYPHLNRKERTTLEAKRLGEMNYIIQSIKYCDIIDNCKDIYKYDSKFGKVYIKEKQLFLEYMTNGNTELKIKAIETINKSLILINL
jgi:guanosine-3',5'-bis(diphosphate) 3'-pyrophosphohydrolase